MYKPQPNSNIGAIYNLIGYKPITFDQLKAKLEVEHPEIPANSYHTHLHFLIKKDVIVFENGKYMRINGHDTQAELIPKMSKSGMILQFLKKNIGKKVDSTLVREALGFAKTDTIPPTALSLLAERGALQHIEGTKPYSYLVLPEIKMYERIPGRQKKNKEIVKHEPVVQTKNNNDIASMSIGEILTKFVEVQQENERLKGIIQRIAHELSKEIEIG